MGLDRVDIASSMRPFPTSRHPRVDLARGLSQFRVRRSSHWPEVLQVFVVAIGLATAVLAIRIVRILTRSGLARAADRSVSQAGSPGVW